MRRALASGLASQLATGAALITLALLLAAPARAVDVSGHVVDAEGNAVPFVRLRLEGKNAVPFTRTVFSASDGTFAAHYEKADAKSLQVDAFRIGWKELDRSVQKTASGLEYRIRLHRIPNVAEQVPPSAWLKGDPNSMAYQMTTTQCSNCHQLGAARVRAFASKLADQPVGDRAEQWVTRAADDLAGPVPGKTEEKDPKAAPAHGRVAGWEAIVQYMRWATMRLGEKNELRWGLKEGSPFYEALLQPDTSLFSTRDMAIVVPNLARNFPVNFDSYTDYDDLERLGDYGVTKDTRIDEFVLPTFGWTREIAVVPGSKKIWIAETDKDRLGALDPTDGSVKWYVIPGEVRQGPHTMNSDAKGNVWLALEESFNIGRFDTKTEQWRLYPPPAGTVFGVTHDFAYNSERHVETDSKGRIYVTDMGMNELWALNVETGKIEKYRQPLPVGESNFHSLLYGTAIDAKRNRVWWAQLYGNVGAFDTEANLPERIIPFKRGEGPRRLALQDDGTLWIPLYGAGQVVRINPDTGEETGRFTLPDRGAGPYGVTYDKRRNAIWAATSNSDRIYRLDIATQKWRQYPTPRKETYIRVIEIDPATGDLWTTYSSLPVGRRDPKVYGIESANNIVIRLHPGD
jgi:streptogramin lyase/mono/diheme cytochrome c family protein